MSLKIFLNIVKFELKNFFFFFFEIYRVKITFFFLVQSSNCVFKALLVVGHVPLALKEAENILKLSILNAFLPSILSFAVHEPRDKLHGTSKVMTSGEIFTLCSHQLNHFLLFHFFLHPFFLSSVHCLQWTQLCLPNIPTLKPSLPM